MHGFTYICSMSSFEDFKLNKQLLTAIQEAGLKEPTEIQKKAIPSVLSGQDVMGIAQTGTGKTAAFALPILMNLKYAQGEDARALVLSPTRELAIQLGEHFKTFSTYLDLRYVVLYGGVGPKQQIEELESGVDIIISTPNRFMDLYLKGHIGTRSIKVLVMDEADKIMDMGFAGMIHRILEVLPSKRQNLLFSATMNAAVRRIADNFLDFPVEVEITEQATVAETIDQLVYKVPNQGTKMKLLEDLLSNDEDFRRLIVFCRTRKQSDLVYEYLSRQFGQKDVRVIHANKGQNTRINAINAFKSGDLRILVATDVAARGIDVSDVSHVINFDVPIIIEDYVHRVGRTGRAEREGKAITFCNPAEEYYIGKIEQLIRFKIPVELVEEELVVEQTPFSERQAMAREIDAQKKREDPNYKGAFHESKYKNSRPAPSSSKRSARSRRNKRR